MVVSKEQQAEDKMLNELAAIVKKLISGMETLNGVQTQAVATMIKEIAQRNGVSLTTKRHTLDVKRETELGHKALEVKEKLKAADEYLIRLRHKLNMQQEKEHGAQVRRNINLRHNMDNFNDGLTNLKRALTGGAGFQNAIGTTVKKMASMTRSYQELEIANKKVTETEDQLRLKQGTVDNLVNSDDDVAKKNAADALKIAESAHQSAQEGVIAATKPAEGTQGMFKPMFEKLSKLGDFLGKKAVPIGIGVGVAGILMSVIVKSFSASPLFAAMMKMMKFMVTLILMPIGTFFGALLRPILIMLLRKFIIPFYSTYMPQWMKLGTDIGNFIAGWSIDKLEENRNDGKLTWEDFVLTINDLFFKNSSKGDGDGDGDGDGTGDGTSDGTDTTDTDTDKIKDATDGWDSFWTKIITSLSSVGIIAPLAHGALPTDGDVTSPDIEKSDAIKTEYDTGFRDLTPEEIAATEAAAKEAAMTISEAEKAAGMYPVDQEEKDRAEAAAQLKKEKEQAAQKAQDAAMEKARKDHEKKLQQEENQKRLSEALAKPSQSTGADRMAAQAARNAQQETVNTVNPRFAGTPSAGKLSSSLNAGANVGAAMDRNASKGHVNLSTSNMNLSQATRDLLASMNSGVIPAAEGFDGMVNKPTMFLAGESGAEHVKVTPSGGGSGGITVNIQNMNGSDNDLRKLKKTILEVIQESSANRGRI